MPNYAIYDNNVVKNVVIADSKEIAEEITGMNAIDSENRISVGWYLHDGEWIPPSPFPSWNWNGQGWIPPTPYPKDEKNYQWDEENSQWVEVISNGN